MESPSIHQTLIIKYIPLQQGLRRIFTFTIVHKRIIIKYIPLQQGLRLSNAFTIPFPFFNY